MVLTNRPFLSNGGYKKEEEKILANPTPAKRFTLTLKTLTFAVATYYGLRVMQQ